MLKGNRRCYKLALKRSEYIVNLTKTLLYFLTKQLWYLSVRDYHLKMTPYSFA